jgi:hypothetical protein
MEAHQTSGDVETGVDKQNSATPADWADVYAYVDDGEYARVWEIKRESYGTVAVTAYNCNSGLAEPDPTFGKKYFEVEADTETEAWGRKYAKNHQDALTVAQDHFA